MKPVIKFSAIKRCFIAAALFLSTSSAPALADNTATAIEITRGVLESARSYLSSQFSKFQALQGDAQQLQNASDQLQQKLDAAELATTNALNDLNVELARLYALDTQQIIMSDLVAFHFALSEFARRYRQQAGLPVSNPIPGVFKLSGVFFAVRDAMGEIADSLGDMLEATIASVEYYGDMLDEIADELRAMAQDDFIAQDLLKYGAEHYTLLRSTRFQEAAASLTKLPAILNGINASNVALPLAHPCSNGFQTLNHFNTELAQFRPKIDPYEGLFDDFVLEHFEPFIYIYDDFQRFPGMISGYGACLATLRDRMILLRESESIAISENNPALAADFHRQINELNSETDTVNNELILITYRRNQVAERMFGSARAQNIPENAANDWKDTLKAHADNLIASSSLSHGVFRAASALMLRAQLQIDSLKGTAEPDRRGKMSQVAAKLQSIKDNGINKLLSDLQFALTSTRIFANAVRRGGNSLDMVMGTYESAINQQAGARYEDLQELPPLIEATKQAIVMKQGIFDETVRFRQDQEARTAQFKALETSVTSKQELFASVVGVSQLNPIYTTLVARLFQSVAADRNYLAEKGLIDQAVRDLLSQFEGIQYGAGFASFAASNKAIKKKCQKKFKKLKGKAKKKKVAQCVKSSGKKIANWTAVLNSTAAAMRSRIDAEVDESSRPHMKGSSVSEVLNSIAAEQNQMLQLAAQ
ncbi:MAG: hypothetical protein J5J00_04100 [Deltaproteobacteria bacterium]|nr:hypothetical protein [Deltaproteobacteria bacterium]